MKEKNQESYTWNSGVRLSTGSGTAHTNMKSPWGWVSLELQVPVEERASMHLQNYETDPWQPRWILQAFSSYCTSIISSAGKERERNATLHQRRVLVQQEFKGKIQWPDNSPHIKCPSLWESHLGLAAKSGVTAASLFAGAVAGEFRFAQCYDYMKWVE